MIGDIAIGIRAIDIMLSFILVRNRNMIPPKNNIKFLKKNEILLLIMLYNTTVSTVNLDITSPVL